MAIGIKEKECKNFGTISAILFLLRMISIIFDGGDSRFSDVAIDRMLELLREKNNIPKIISKAARRNQPDTFLYTLVPHDILQRKKTKEQESKP